MKKIVVTGATSMIGLSTINEAIKNNVEVLAIVREGSQKIERFPKSNQIRILECNIDKYNTIETSQLEKNYDVFYHFSWGFTDKTTRNDPIRQEKNIQYSLDAVTLGKKLGCKKFIGAGSQAEYGRFEGKLNAQTPIHPDIAYGISKYAAGCLTNLRCKELSMEHIWVRILSVYGIYDSPNTMIGYAINELLSGRQPEFTKSEQIWDYLFSEDAGRALYLIGEKGINNKIYCLGSGKAFPLYKYINIINNLFNKPDNAGIGKKQYSENQVMYLCADIDDLTKDTGFIPEINFEDGIKRTIDFYKGLKNII